MSFQDQWYQQQVEHISEALQELLVDDDPSVAIKGIKEAIDSWADYHEKEAAKWKRLELLLGLATDR